MERPTTRARLERSGWRARTVEDELRADRFERRRADRPLLGDIVGCGRTVLPEVHDGLLTRHDFLLPGPASLQRGAESLDPVPPVVAGREIRDDPLASTAPTAPRSYHRNRRRQVR